MVMEIQHIKTYKMQLKMCLGKKDATTSDPAKFKKRTVGLNQCPSKLH